MDASLQINHYYGAVDLSVGAVNIAAGQALGFYGYGPSYDSKVILGAVTGFGTGALLDMQGSDVLVLTRDLTLPATSPTSGWQLNLSGSNTVNGLIGTETLTNQGTLVLSGDTINVPVINQGTMSLTYSTLTGALDNRGLVLVPSTDFGYYLSGSSATLNGVLTTSSTSRIQVQPGSTLNIARGFTNNGTIELDRGTPSGAPGSSYSSILNVASGTLTNAGTLLSMGAGAANNTLNLNDATLGLPLLNNTAAGSIFGGGTINLGSGTGIMSNNGTVAPSGGGVPTPQVLTIQGNYSQGSTGTLAINIAGASAGQYDQLAVTGSATLDGTLSASLANGFLPSGNQQFQIVTVSSGISGNFASLSLPSGFSRQINPGNVVLAFGSTTCAGTICWDNSDGNGLWTDRFNWNRDVLPDATDVVVIDLGGGTFVVLDSGSHTIASLLAAEHLQISGGSLSVTGTSTFTGGLTISGGAFASAGAISANLMNLSSGSFSVASTALINALNMSGGVVSGGGALTINGSLIATGGQIALDTVTGSLRVVQSSGDLNLGIPVSAHQVDLQTVGSATLDNGSNTIGLVRGSVAGDLSINDFRPLQLGDGTPNGLTVGGNLIARSVAGSAQLDPACVGDSCIIVHGSIFAGGAVSLYSNDLFIAPSTDPFPGNVATALSDPRVNYVMWAPSSQGTNITLDDLANVGSFIRTPRLIFGDPGNLGAIGNLNWAATIATAGELGPIRAIETYATSIDFTGHIGDFNRGGLPVSLQFTALESVNIGTTDFASIILANDRSLRLRAGISGIGDLNIGGGPGVYLHLGETIANTGSMELLGANVTIAKSIGADWTTVELLGTGIQSIETPGLLTITSDGGNGLWLSAGTQSITAGAMKVNAAGGSKTYVHAANAQTITVDQSGYTGPPRAYGIEVINNGGGEASINTEGAQTISVLNSGGVLVDAAGGNANIRGGGYWGANGFVVDGGQRILVDGTGANNLVLRGGSAVASIEGGNQSIRAGTGTNAGSISLLGSLLSTSNNGGAYIWTHGGTQTISTTGLLSLIAGTAPDGGQSEFTCFPSACALIGNFSLGSDPSTPIQSISATGGLLIQGGADGLYNEAAIFSRGSQTVNAPGGITLKGGDAGFGNYAFLGPDRAGYSQYVDFGAGNLTLVSGTGGNNNWAMVRSQANQTITGTGDIVMRGGQGGGSFTGIAGTFQSSSFAASIFGGAGFDAFAIGNPPVFQNITANSISITAVSGPLSSGIFIPTGTQHVTTTGAAANGYGVSIENLGATGVDPNGYGTAAFLTTRTGTQQIDVAQGGLLIKGTAGVAVIDTQGPSQTINIASGNLDIQAGLGAAFIYFANGSSQSISATNISLQGGTQALGKNAYIEATGGTQTITASGTLSLAGGNATGPAPNANPIIIDGPALASASSGSATIISRLGQQTISADSVSLTGGGGRSENFANIRGDAGQTINVGAGGMRLTGGNGAGVHNFALIENYGGNQILNFASSATLDITGGDLGRRNFAGIFGGGSITYDYSVLANTPLVKTFTKTTAGTTSQQILGAPTINLLGGATGGGGDNTESSAQRPSNGGFIIAQTGSQQINANSITMTGGGGLGENDAKIAAWEAGQSQVIDSSGAISLTGGSALYAVAEITSAGTQTIHAGGISLTGGTNNTQAEMSANGAVNVTSDGNIVEGSNSLIRGGSVVLSAFRDITLGNVVATQSDGDFVSALSVTARNGGVVGIDIQNANLSATVGSISLTSPTSVRVGSGTTISAGTVNLTAADLNLASDFTLATSEHLIPIAGSMTITGPGFTLTNLGTLSNISSITTNLANEGTLSVSSGATAVSGNLSGSGTLNVSGGTLNLNAPATTGTLNLSAGTMTAAASVNVTNLFNWTGGTIATGAEIDLSGTGSISAGPAKTLDGKLANSGTLAVLDNVSGTGVLENTNRTDVASVTVRPRVLNSGALTILPGSGATFGSSLTNSGTLLIAANDTTNASLIIAGNVLNNSTIELRAGATGNSNAGLGLTSGSLTNTNNGRISSTGNAGISFNRLSGNIVSSGTLDVTESLRMDNEGFTFTNDGTLSIAAAKQLFVNGGATGTTLNLNTGLFIGSNATLRLGHVQVNAPNTIVNRGGLIISGNTDIVGALNNDGTLEVHSLGNSIGSITNNGTIAVIADSGLASVDIGAGFTNNGLIDLIAGGAADGSGFNLTAGTLTNAGYIRSRTLGSSGFNTIGSSVVNTGTIDTAYNLAINGALAIPSSGTGVAVTGAGNLTLNGAFTWSAGTIQGAGAFTSGGTTKLDGADKVLAGRTFDANGPVNWNGTGLLTLSNGATFNNNATMTVSNDFQMIGTGTGPNTFNNAGTFTKSAGNITGFITTIFNNSGTVNVDSGKLSFNGGSNSSGTFNVAGGAILEFGTGTHVLDAASSVAGAGNLAVIPGGLLTQSGAFSLTGSVEVTGTGNADFAAATPMNPSSVSVTTGTLNFDGVQPVTTNSLTNSGGTLGGTASISTGALTWIGGTIQGAGGLTVNGATNLNGGAKTLSGRALDLGGAVAWDGSGLLTLNNGATLNNNANMTVGGNFTIFDGGTGTNTFNNTGAFTNSGGASLSRITTPFNNSGSVVVTGDVTVSGTFAWSGGTLAGPGIVHVNNLFTWTGGTIAAGAEIDLSGLGSISTGVAKTLDGKLSNSGTLTILDNVSGTGVLHNTSQMDAASVTIQPAVINDGLLTIRPGTGTFFGGTLINSTGATLSLASNGTTLATLIVTGDVLNDGLINLQAGGAGATNAGFGVTTGTLTNSGTIRSSGDSGIFFNRLSGNIVNNGALDVADSLRMDNEGHTFTQAGTVTIAAREQLFLNGNVNRAALNLNSGLAIGTGSSLRLGNVTVNGPGSIQNSGTVFSGGTDIRTTVVNSGLITVEAMGNTIDTIASNTGTIAITTTAGLGRLTVSNGFTNDGTIVLDAGANGQNAAIVIGSSGTLTLVNAAGATIRSITSGSAGSGAVVGNVVNSGLIDAAHDLTITGALTIPSTASGVVVDGAGNLTVNGALSWGAGRIAGSAGSVLNTGGASSVSGAADLDTRSWNNSGAATIGGTGSLRLFNGANVNNLAGATLDITGSSLQAIFSGLVGAPVALNNAGTLTKVAGSAAIQLIDAVALNNSGTVNVNEGTLLFTSFPTNSGTLNITAGATLSTNNNNLSNAGIIGGAGTLNLGTGTLTNAGTIRAGNSPGTLTIGGNLTLTSTSVLDFELGGTGAGQFDVVNVTGAAALDGAANIILVPGFAPVKGDSFQVLNALGGVTGQFAALGSPTDTTFNAAYGLNGVTFDLAVLINRWTGTSGVWTNINNWSRKRTPLGTDDVVIDVAGSTETVTVDPGTHAAGSLLTLENLSINGGDLSITNGFTAGPLATVTVTSGSLALNGPSSVAGTLAVNGGTLAANELLNASNLILSSGAITAKGTLSAAAFDWQGGSLFGSGALNVTGPLGAVMSGSGIRVLDGPAFSATILDLQGGSLDILSGSLAIAASGTIAPSATLTLSGGTFDVGAATALDVAGTLNLNGGGFVPPAGALNNNGLVNINVGTLTLGGGGNGSGTYLLASGTSLNFGAGLYTAGAISGAGDVGVQVAATVSVADLTAGNVTVSGALGVSSTGNIGALSLTGSFDASGLIAIGDLAISGGTMTGAGSVSVSNAFDWSGGSISGTGSLTTSGITTLSGAATKTLSGWTWDNFGTVNWTTGSLDLANPQSVLNNQSGAIFNLQNTSNAENITGAGTINNAGSVVVKSSANDTTIFTGFNNTGSVTVTSGIFQMFGSGSDSGSYVIGAGTVLDFAGGSTRVLQSPASVSGPGVMNFSPTFGAATVTLQNGVSYSPGSTLITGGNVAFNNVATTGDLTLTTGTLRGSGDFTTNIFNWSGGTLAGTGNQFIVNGPSTLSGTTKTIDGRVWTNNGIATWNGAGTLQVTNTSTLVNAGTFTISGAGNIDALTGANTISNLGTFTKTGAGTAVVFGTTAPLTFDNGPAGLIDVRGGALQIPGGTLGGTLSVATGAQLLLEGGTNQFQDGSLITGGGAFIFVPGFGGSLGFVGTTTGTTIDVGATLNLDTVSAGGAGVVNNLGTLALSSATFNAQINNSGTMSANAASTLNGALNNSGNATVNNSAVNGSVSNSGRLTATSSSFGGALANTGTIDVAGGTVILTNGGSGSYGVANGALLDFAGGTYALGSITGTGGVDVTGGSVSLNGNSSVGALAISSGALSVNSGAALSVTGGLNLSGGTLSGSGDVGVAGQFAWTGGTVNGAGSFSAAGGQFGGGLKQLDGRTMTINGPLNFGGTNGLDMSNGAVLTVNGPGTLDTSASGTSSFGINSVSGAPASVNFLGGLVKLGAQPFDLSLTANTDGTVRAQAGQLAFAGGGTHTNTAFAADAGAEISFSRGIHIADGNVSFGGAGQTHIGTGARFQPATGSSSLVNNGLLLIDTGAIIGANLINVGNINFGDSVVAGNLTNTGSINISSGVVSVEGALSSSAAGSVVNVSGGTLGGGGDVTASVLNFSSGSLSGTGNLVVTSNFTQSGGSVGNQYQILSLRHIGNFAVGSYGATGSLNLTAAGGALLINDVSLDAPNISLAGNNVILKPTTRSGSLVNATNLSIVTPGSLSLDGSNGPSKLQSAGTMDLSVGSLNVIAGAYTASIDPAALNVSTTGDIVLSGGPGNNASAVIAGASVNVSGANVILSGGTGNNSYATIAGTSGDATVNASKSVIMTPGTGSNADASIAAPLGKLTITAASCTGCILLGADPTSDQGTNQGVFGSTVVLNLPPSTPAQVQVDNSIIYASTLAISGGEANTSYSSDAEEEDKGKDKGKNQDVKEEGKNAAKPKRNLPICM